MSYQKLNQVTHPFTFPIPLCDDVVQDIDTEAKYFIAVDIYSGYWQVVSEEEALKRHAFFTPDVKWQWKMIPIGSLNAAPTFVAMAMKLQIKWYELSKERGLKNVASKIIVDDVLLYGRTAGQLLAYFKTVLDVLKHHHAIIKLKRCK